MIAEISLGQDAPAIHETHTSMVFLIGDRAYKLKKPLAFPFVDFSTREPRLAACRREVELNRSLAPDVHQGVITVTDAGGAPADHLADVTIAATMANTADPWPDAIELPTSQAPGQTLAHAPTAIDARPTTRTRR